MKTKKFYRYTLLALVIIFTIYLMVIGNKTEDYDLNYILIATSAALILAYPLFFLGQKGGKTMVIFFRKRKSSKY